MALRRAKLGDRVKFSERKHRVGPRARRSCSCNFLSVCAGGSNRAIYAVGSIAHRTRPRRQKESPGRVLCYPQGQQQRLHLLPLARSRPYSSSHRRVCPKSGDGGNGSKTAHAGEARARTIRLARANIGHSWCSPLNDTPAAVSHRSHNPAPSKASANGTSFTPSERADGACHHYRVWSYPWPQPLCETSAPSPPEQAKNLPNERADGACHHYRVWSYPWAQPC